MSDKSFIEWTATVNADGSVTPGSTWNPVRGCVKVSPGCRFCYAETFAERWRGIPGHPYEQGFNLRLVPEKLKEPLKWRKPRRIFVNSMSDLFQDGVPDEFIDQVFAVMALAPQHTFQVLTKRPDRMRDYMNDLSTERCTGRGNALLAMTMPPKAGVYAENFRWPLPNVWLGVSAENQEWADKRIHLLLQTPAAVRFVSYEPALGPIDFRPYLNGRPISSPFPVGLDWIIAGSESGPKRRPADIRWYRSVRDQCQAAGIAFFFKQHIIDGKKTGLPELDGKQWEEFPLARS